MTDGPIVPRGRRAEFLLVRIPHLVVGTLFLAAIAINFANVVGRYVFFKPIFWAEEVLVFLIVWSVFIAAASIVYRGEMINMDLFYAAMKGAARRAVNVAIWVVFVAASLIVIVQSFKALQLQAASGGVSVAAGIPMVVPHAAILVGFLLMLVAALVRWRAYVNGKFD